MVTRKEFIQDTQDSFTTFRDLVHCLERFVLATCSLQRNQNPIVRELNSLSNAQIRWAIQEYSQFSNEAVHMLLDARLRTHEWKKLSEEIDRNIEEEKGSQTKGVPHLETMRRGYMNNLDFDVNDHKPAEITQFFLLALRKVFRRKNNPYLAGALAAFESVSIPEFYALDALVAKYMGDDEADANLTSYIEGHKFFEVGHKEGLLTAVEPYIDAFRAAEFAAGYLDVCEHLSDWWNNLLLYVREREKL